MSQDPSESSHLEPSDSVVRDQFQHYEGRGRVGRGRQAIADSLANLGFVTLHQDDYARARSLYEEALAIHRELGIGQGIADSLSHLALISFYQGDLATARARDEESLNIWRTLGDQQGVAWALHRLGNVTFHQGDPLTASRLFKESLTISTDLGFKWGMAFALEGLASVAALQRQPERALRLAAAASALRKVIGIPLSTTAQATLDRTLAPARAALDAQQGTAAWTRGQDMGADDITRYALEEATMIGT